MSQINSLTVNDGATTPVARTLNRYDVNGTRSNFATDTAALVKGQIEMIHSATKGAKANSANIAKLTVIFPVEATVDGITKVDSVSTATVQFNFAQSLTATQRQTFYGLVTNILLDANVKAQNIAVAPLS